MRLPSKSEVTLHGQRSDSGIALILVMLAMLVLTTLGASIVFTARSETFASVSYRLNTQADYVAKAGIESAMNWFRSNHYAPVSSALANTDYAVTSDGSVYNLYTSNNSPVQCKANCGTLNSAVQLIGYGSGSTNFPSGITNGGGTAIGTAFSNDLNGTGTGTRVTGDSDHSGLFWVNAYLLNYQTVNCSTCAQNPMPMETWLVTSKGTWTGRSSQSSAIATAEEQAIVQPIYSANFGNALYGYCSVTMSGSAGVCTDAFDSALGAYGGGNPTVASGACSSTTATNVIASGAGVGANGYVTTGSNVTIAGNVTIGNADPSLIPSTCCSGSACGAQNSGTVDGSVITGAPYVAAPAAPTFPGSGQSITFPGTAPSYSSGTAPQTSSSNSTNPTGTITPGANSYAWPCVTGATCDGSAANPYLVSSISPNGTNTVTLVGGANAATPVYYDINSISYSGQASLTVTGFVVLNVKTTLSIAGQGIANSLTVQPEALQINFAGTSASLGGNGGMSAVITAPNASVSLGGGGSSGFMVGAIRAANISDQGGYPVHYDIQLNRLQGTMAQSVVSSYSRIKQ
jgi:hypothetical protein